MRVLRGALLRAVSSNVVAVRALACKGSAVRALSGKGSAAWNEEWRWLGLGAVQEASAPALNRLMFVQTGFGCDQHGDRKGAGATSAAVRACRNAIEFNSIPGMVDHVPGGRKNMLIHVKLGIPEGYSVDHDEIRATFPYGRLLPVEVIHGGLTYGCGRVVTELGDEDDTAIVVVAAVSIGYNDPNDASEGHKTYDTRDGH
mmetsp:Transcript_32991/g.108985  ORF Transcript_32991/g.108985 Transcript_32991/m.108985 type:complete len:201 (-) Transcript_32991:59-661(-)